MLSLSQFTLASVCKVVPIIVPGGQLHMGFLPTNVVMGQGQGSCV